MARGAARRSGTTALACWAALAAGCDSGRRLETVTHVTVRAEGVKTLHVDRAGRAWLGGPSGLIRLDEAGDGSSRVDLTGPTAARVALEGPAVLYVLSGDVLHAVPRDSAAPVASRPGFGGAPVVLDPRGRFVAQGARSGAVLGFHPETLEPLWAWPARGAPTAALSVTPEGDVVWQVLAPSREPPVLLERDLQTGRILDRHPVEEDVRFLTVAPDGDLLLVVGDGARLQALRLRPRGTELVPVWREALELGGEGPPLVRYAPAAGLVAVFRPGSDAGLRVLDAEAGALVGIVEDTPLDAGFSDDGALYLLTPREIRRVRIDR